MTVALTLTCDGCGECHEEDIKTDENAETVMDREGWSLGGTLLDEVRCPDCEDES